MVDIPVRKLSGIIISLVGVGVVLIPWFWTISLEHSSSLEFQLFSLSVGLAFGGWIIGNGAFVTWDNNKYLTYGLLASGIGFLAIILIAGTAGFRQ